MYYAEFYYTDCLVIQNVLGLDLRYNKIQNNETQHNNTECHNERIMLSVITQIVLSYLGAYNIQNNDTQHNNTECCNEPIMLSVIILTVLSSYICWDFIKDKITFRITTISITTLSVAMSILC